jgi:hypothetical protein
VLTQQGVVLQAQSFSVESVLSGILYMRLQHYTEQLAVVAVLDWLLQQNAQVGLAAVGWAAQHRLMCLGRGGFAPLVLS